MAAAAINVWIVRKARDRAHAAREAKSPPNQAFSMEALESESALSNSTTMYVYVIQSGKITEK
jgi:hypothetical protein